jgi:4-hydroxybenzoate polyprenyltransferase
MKDILYLLRPRSWLKNGLIFGPIFFAKDFFVSEKLFLTFIAFISFCLVASAVYVLNDDIDKEVDRLHEKKKDRPIASGKISEIQARGLTVFLLVLSFTLLFFFIPKAAPYICAYFFINVLYSLYLKHIAIVDVVVISLFYVIRILVGGVAAGVPVSSWLIMCTIFLSLFLILGKRIAEFKQSVRRKSLEGYTEQFLYMMLSIAAAVSILSYSLYVILVLQSPYAIYTMFFVLMGIMRYIYLIITSNTSEYPERLIFGDRVVLISVLGWIILVYSIFY